MEIPDFMKRFEKAMANALLEHQKEQDKKPKDKQVVNVNNNIDLGGKKIHESRRSWEEEFLLRNFVPVR